MRRMLLSCALALVPSVPALSSAPSNPMPPDGATGVAQHATLTWTVEGAPAPGMNTLYGAAFQGAGSGDPGPSTLYTIDPDTGVFTPVGPIGFNGVNAMEFGADGALYAVAAGETGSAPRSALLIRINPATGEGTLLGVLGTEGGAGVWRVLDLARSPSGLLYGSGYTASPILYFSLDVSGAPAVTPRAAVDYYPGGLDFQPDGTLMGVIYDTSLSGPDNAFATINPDTGATTIGVPPTGQAAGDFATSGALRPGSSDYYFSLRKYPPANEWRLMRADPATGVVTLDKPGPVGFDALAFAPFTATYDVYLDTANPPTTLVCDDAAEPSCQSPALQRCTTYYWRVVATVNGTPMEGPVWSFTTGFFSPADTDGDGDVDFIDLNAVLSDFGMGPACPPAP